jgi:AraC family transcriptional activator of tynA and feaB
MFQSGSFTEPTLLDYDTWMTANRSICGRYNPVGVDPCAFVGWIRPLSVCGFELVHIGCNAGRIERTHRDVRLDDRDHLSLLFQIAGRTGITQNNQDIQFEARDVTLLDATRPVTCLNERNAQWNFLCLHLPRESLVSNLGFEPQGGLAGRRGAPSGHLLFELVRTAVESDESRSDPYMKLAVYDLVGALFGTSGRRSVSGHSDKLFARLRELITDRFADPEFGPCEVASEAGISLRYLHKLFAARSLTCSEFIYSVRLDQAARLVRRRTALGSRQPFSEIAYACGFQDYTHFARKFRRRFGYTPGGRGGGPRAAGDGTMRPGLSLPPKST